MSESIVKMYAKAEADAIHWREKYRDVQQIRAAERTGAQKLEARLRDAEVVVGAARELRMALLEMAAKGYEPVELLGIQLEEALVVFDSHGESQP